MDSDIWIVRDGNSYRLLHGHLHLVNELSLSGEVYVDVKDEGRLKVVRTTGGFLVGADGDRLPLRWNWSGDCAFRPDLSRRAVLALVEDMPEPGSANVQRLERRKVKR